MNHRGNWGGGKGHSPRNVDTEMYRKGWDVIFNSSEKANSLEEKSGKPIKLEKQQ